MKFKLFNRNPKDASIKEPKIETVDDLLTKDDVNSVVQDAVENKKDMKCIVMVWLDNDNGLHYYSSTDRPQDIIYMLEECKFQFQMSGNHDESED